MLRENVKTDVKFSNKTESIKNIKDHLTSTH